MILVQTSPIAPNRYYENDSVFSLNQIDEYNDYDLHLICRNGSVEKLKEALKRKYVWKRVNRKDSKGLAPLHYAAKQLHFNIVELLLEVEGIDIFVKDSEGATPLHYAVKRKDVVANNYNYALNQTLNALITELKKTTRVGTVEDNYMSTPLHLAAIRNNVDAINILCEYKDILDINAKDKCGATALHEASTYNNIEACKALINNGADILIPDEEGSTPLHLACMEGDVELVEVLLAEAKNKNELAQYLNKQDKEDHNTALHLSIENRHPAVTRLLIDNEADITIRRISGNTALHIAASSNDVESAKLLLEKKLNINELNNYQSSPAHLAAEHNSVDVMKLFIEKYTNFHLFYHLFSAQFNIFPSFSPHPLSLFSSGANLALNDIEHKTPFLRAVSYKSYECVEILLQHSEDCVLDRDDSDYTCIMLASEENDAKTLELLLGKLSKKEKIESQIVNSVNREGFSALHIGAAYGLTSIVELLAANSKISIENKDDDENTAFHLAAANGHIEVCRTLYTKDRKSVHYENEESETPLHLAAKSGQSIVVENLVEWGADKNARTAKLWTPLDFAASNGHLQTVRELIDNEVILNPEGKEKETPLHHACKNGHADVVKVLIEEGANVTALDEEGSNCLDLAIDNNHKDVALVLVESKKWREVLFNYINLRNIYSKEIKQQKENEEKDKVSLESSTSKIKACAPKKPKRYKPKGTTPMRKLIRHMPDIAKIILDKCLTTEQPNETSEYTYEIAFDFECIDDTYFWYQNDSKERIPYTNQSTLIKENHPLRHMVETAQESLLKHALTIALIRKKWQIALIFYVFFLIFYSLFLGTFTAYMLIATPSYKVNSTNCKKSDIGFFSNQQTPYEKFATYLTYILGGIGMIIELIQAVSIKTKYLQWGNLLDWFTYIGAMIVVINFRECGAREKWQWELGAMVLYFAWIDFILYLRRFPRIGIYIVMVTDILNTFWKFSFVLLLFLIASGFSLYVILQNQYPFVTPSVSLVKAAVMMIGEFDYGNIFDAWREDPSAANQLHYTFSSYFLFILFMIVMSIIVMNLLTALAIDDVNEMKREAESKKLGLQIDLALDVEVAIPSMISPLIRRMSQRTDIMRIKPENPVSALIKNIWREITGTTNFSQIIESYITNTDSSGEESLTTMEENLGKKIETNQQEIRSVNEKLDRMESLLLSLLHHKKIPIPEMFKKSSRLKSQYSVLQE
ncbi:DgyrCDS8355 [Dimorphilus gyrociliatus]|uniref:DgyrCDS8355 n=1 Tax=Dimorphilus gyrociliatus TaxID=2664684 RepID=A0A7I8VW91_9ANNE|nr:DgyrCDS8355 [Dimorphilus gyrociliatus]